MLQYHPRFRALYFCLVFLTWLLGFLLFPQTVITVRDEAGYLGTAQFMINSHSLDFAQSLSENDGLLPWFTEHDGRRMPRHPLGLSFLAIPFLLLFGLKGAYLLQVLLFFLGAFFFEGLLRRRGLSSSYLLPYLFFPPLMLYTRFFLADMPSAVFCLGALYFLDRDKTTLLAGMVGGLCLGMAFFIKPVNALFIGPFAFFYLLKAFRERTLGPAILFSITGFFFLGLQLFVNHRLSGHWLSFSYDTRGMFGAENLHENIPFYLLALGVCYPAMWLGLRTFVKERSWHLITAFFFGILFYCFYNYIDYDPHPLFSLVRGQRFLLPFVAFLLIGYATLLGGWSFFHRNFERYFLLLLLSGCVMTGVLCRMHYRYGLQNQQMRDFIYSFIHENDEEAILYNVDSAEIVHGVYGQRNYRMINSGLEFDSTFQQSLRKYRRILVVETDHVYKKGPDYAVRLMQEPPPAGFNVELKREQPPFRLVCFSRK